MNGLNWYKKVYKFLSSQKSYLIITQSEEQKLSLINIINSHKGQGIRLKAEYKKFGLCLCRGRKGAAAIVTIEVLNEFCKENGIRDIDTYVHYYPEHNNRVLCGCCAQLLKVKGLQNG